MTVTRNPSFPPSGSPAYSPDDLPLYRGGQGGAADPISILGDKLAAWYVSEPSTLFTTSTGETQVTTAGDPVGLRVNRVSGGPDAIQSTAAARPLWQTGPDRLVYDGADDALRMTLPAISGGQIVISSPVGIWIDSLNFAGGTFSLGPTTYTGGPARLWATLNNAEIEVCVLNTAMTTEQQNDLVNYLVRQGSAGLITLGPELVTNGTFDTDTAWTKGTGWTISGGTAQRSAVDSGSMVSQTLAIASGATYRCRYNITAIAAGTSNIRLFGGTANTSQSYGATGMVYEILDNTGANTQVGIAMSTSNGTLTIDNASVREIIFP